MTIASTFSDTVHFYPISCRITLKEEVVHQKKEEYCKQYDFDSLNLFETNNEDVFDFIHFVLHPMAGVQIYEWINCHYQVEHDNGEYTFILSAHA